MSGKNVSFDVIESVISYSAYRKGETNAEGRERMKKVVSAAVKYEITERQREFLFEYFFAGKTMAEIAAEKNVHKSTVSRTISRAILRLRQVSGYY